MKTFRVLLCFGVFLSLCLSACAAGIPPTDATIITDVPIPLPGEVLPVCTSAELTRISGETLDAVVLGTGWADFPVIDGLTPKLNWNYDDSTCTPSGFVVSIFTYNPDQSPNLVAVHEVGPAERSYTVTSADGLMPATYYRWFAQPFSGSSSSVDPTDTTGYPDAFFTGPLCAAGAVKAPILTFPDDEAVITGENVNYSWIYPDHCLPNRYEIVVATDESLTTKTMEKTQPYLNFDSMWWEAGGILKDCTRYYWRVGVSGDDSTFVYSETRSYYYNKDGTCPAEPSVPMSITIEPTANPTAESPANPAPYDCSQYTDYNSCTGPGGNFCQWAPTSPNSPEGDGTCINNP